MCSPATTAIPLLAINAPREVVSAVRRKGFQGLTAEEAAHVPTDIDSKNAEHLRLFRASFEEGSFHGGMDEAAWQSMLDAQCTWDATMGFHAVQPLVSGDDPKAVVVVLVGAGHVQYGLGIERQVRRSFAGRRRVGDPRAREGREDRRRCGTVQASYANFVWGTPPETDPIYPDLGVSTSVRAQDKLLEIMHVEEDSPAARGGLKYGDVLLSLDGGRGRRPRRPREGDGRQALGGRGRVHGPPRGRDRHASRCRCAAGGRPPR